MDEVLLATLKALADESRLRIVGLLAARPFAVEELAVTLSLTPGTVVHHLKRLEAVGLVERRPLPPYVEYALCRQRLHDVGRRLGGIPAEEPEPVAPGPDGTGVPPFDAKVLRTFVVDGRLVSIPAQEKKRQVVLRYLADRCFDRGREYAEVEVNERLRRYHPDVAALRRYLVGARLMTRSRGVYWRA